MQVAVTQTVHVPNRFILIDSLYEPESGVYKVHINAEEQKVTVTGSVDPFTLVQKLVKYGKHAEIWNANPNQEQDNHVKDSKNKNHTQYLINGPNASENQHKVPNLLGDEDHHEKGNEWYLDQDMGSQAVAYELDQNPAAPLTWKNENNRTHQNFRRTSGSNMWEENMTPKMSLEGLGSQEWVWHPSFPGGAPITQNDFPSYQMNNIYGYYQNCHPAKMMQLYHHPHLPMGGNYQMQDLQTINQMSSPIPFNFDRFHQKTKKKKILL